VAGGLALAREQAVELIQCLAFDLSRLSTRVVFEAHEESPPLSGPGLHEPYAPEVGIIAAPFRGLAFGSAAA
jgi:hypothetical protein